MELFFECDTCGKRILIRDPAKHEIKHREYGGDAGCDGTLMMLSVQPYLRKK
jgi:hypothetical protein